MKAAVMRAYKQPLEIEEVQIDKPSPHEVLVRTAATGVCHSDLHVLEGALPIPPPTIMGHEPSGIVEEVGEEVRHVQPGDHVIGCLSAFCGHCEFCLSGRPSICGGAATMRGLDEAPRLSQDGQAILQFAHLSSFAEQMLVHENALVKIREDMPLDRAALIGCGVTTGLGAALNTAAVRPGSSVAVIGCGGVGLSAIQGSRIAGAGRIVAVDTAPWKLELAKQLGATDGVDASSGNPVAAVQELTGGGVDYALEALGLKETVEQSWAMTRRGGTCVVIGLVPLGVNVEIPGLDIVFSAKTMVGCSMGSNRFRVDMPRYIDFYLRGLLKLDEMISARLRLDQINEAFDKMRAGEAARSVIVFD
jgi:S-(hydroxymethyl)glutathione dehydrogenase/alcohol dehydrogenase